MPSSPRHPLFEAHRATIEAGLQRFRPQKEQDLLPGWVWVCLFTPEVSTSFLWTRWTQLTAYRSLLPLADLEQEAAGRAGFLVIIHHGAEVVAEWVAQEAVPADRVIRLLYDALDTYGGGPEDSPGHDREARDLMFAALERLAPGLGNPDVLGLPCPKAPDEGAV